MKPLLLAAASVAAFALTSAADAADLAVRFNAPPVPPPAFSWTGFYVGGNFGGGFGDKWWDNNNPLDNHFWFGFPGQSIGTTSMDGLLGGGQVGYNWQFASPIVVGVEGTFDGSDISGHFNTGIPGNLTMTNASKLNWLSTVVGRIGVTVDDHALIYAGGGAAWTDEKDSVVSFGPGLGGFPGQNISYSGSTTETGWTVLAGVEYAINPNWSARLQYNYIEFNNPSITMPAGNPGTTAVTGSMLGVSTPLRLNVVMAGLNYRFNWW
jgi:outer membrane immunogenic protein